MKYSYQHIFLALLLVLQTYSISFAYRKLIVLDATSEAMDERELRHLDRVMRLSVLQSRFVQVIPFDKWKSVLDEKKETVPSPCFLPTCLARVASSLPQTEWILTNRIEIDPVYYRISFRIYDIQAGQIIVDYTNKRQSAEIDLTRMMRESVREVLRRAELGLNKPTSKSELISRVGPKIFIASAALAAAAGFVTYKSGMYSDHTANEDVDWVDAGYDNLNFSNLRGFFAIPGIAPAIEGMGGAGLGHVHDLSAVHINPAGLGGLDRQAIQFSQAELPSSIPSFSLGYGGPLSEAFFFAAAARYEGDQIGSESVLSFALANDLAVFFPGLSQLLVGVTLKMYHVSVGELGDGEDRSKGYSLGGGFDVGIQFPVTDKIRFGTVLRDPWSLIYHQNTVTNHIYREVLPFLWTIGFSYSASPSLVFAIDGEKGLLSEQPDVIRLGGSKTFLDLFSARLGTNQIMGQELARNITMGLGLQGSTDRYRLHIDYAFDFAVDRRTTLENVHHFGICIGF